MSWSLQIANGDLVLNGTSLATVTDGAKLVQDLTCDLLEPMGTDDAHPTFGSLIDGGIQNGVYQPGVIGEQNNDQAATFVQSEVSRVCSDYQKSQIARNNSDASTYGKPTITPGETLIQVENISIQESQDQMLVGVTLRTGAGTIATAVTVGN
jgi:hypothetical protein